MNDQNVFNTARRNIAKNNWWMSLLLSFVLFAANSCGGGAALLAGGGIGGTGVISVGPILAFGSIWVNGVEYNITDANITVNGTTASQADLTRGMIVRVKGTVNPNGVGGNAESVTFSRDISGIISDIDHENQTITILGQTIFWDNETFGDDNDPGTWIAPAVGDYVEISGLPTQNGWLARAINHNDPTDEDDISGVLNNLNTMTQTFTINDLTIHYQSMSGSLRNGDYIMVTGQLQGDIFNALRLEMRHPELGGDDEDMEVEGMVFEYNPNTKTLTMMSSGGRYSIDANGALFKNGGEADLAPGTRIEVSGYIQSSIFFAEEIEFKGGN